MDQTLKLKLTDFKKALLTLEKAIQQKKTALVRDAVIKRFEYTYEIAWKTAKVYLYKKFGVDVFSPKSCFRELLKNKIISEKETTLFIEMTDNRNEIIHNYDENFSNLLYPKIKKSYYQILKKLFEIISAK